MSNRELEKLRARRELQEKRAREITESLARALGVSAEELDQVEYVIDPQRDDNGVLQGFIIYFWDGATPEFLAKIEGLVNGRWVRIGPVL